MRIGFLSDLHITHNTNMLAQSIDSVVEACQNAEIDKLFIAGDTSNNYNTTLEFIDSLSELGIDAYTIFGNHEYWSIAHEKVNKINNDRYINGKVVDLDNNTILIGIDGFFDYSFVTKVNNPYTRELQVNKKDLTISGKNYFDLDKIKTQDYDRVFNDMETQLIKNLEENKGKKIILMMHYVPSSEFAIYNTDKIWTTNNAFMGSTRYQEIAEEYKVDKVIFGHTHNEFNREINGVNYHCNPVGYGSFEFTETFRERIANTLKVIEV